MLREIFQSVEIELIRCEPIKGIKKHPRAENDT